MAGNTNLTMISYVLLTMQQASERVLKQIIGMMLLALVVSGCSANQKTIFQSGLAEPEPARYIYYSRYRSDTCYTRVEDGFAIDQICQRGDYLKYTQTPKLDKNFKPMPHFIAAAFIALENPENRGKTITIQ